MAKKSAISGEYVISVEDSGSIVVYRNFDNVKASLREVAELKNFEYDTNWNTRQFGKKLCTEFGDGSSAEIGEYYINGLHPSTAFWTLVDYKSDFISAMGLLPVL